MKLSTNGYGDYMGDNYCTFAVKPSRLKSNIKRLLMCYGDYMGDNYCTFAVKPSRLKSNIKRLLMYIKHVRVRVI